MNKYTEMSDLEINKHVFVAAKIEHEDTDLHSNKVFYGDGANWIEFNPCNNPADAMPIIIDSRIGLHPADCGDWWVAVYEGLNQKSDIRFEVNRYESRSKNLLRACMEVYLIMKDAENENNNNG